jgi:enoyl-CoA hydratase/carnithine racemase
MTAAERMAQPKIYAEREAAFGWIVFNQPEKRNAMSLEMWQALPDLIRDHVRDPEVRVILLRGAGNAAFVSGADISQFESVRANLEQAEIYNRATDVAQKAIKECEKPTVAMIYGYCFGGGMGIASSCDLRIAAETARFRIPAARLGLAYAFEGIRHLISLVGAAAAREIFLTASTYSAEEMLRIGYLQRVFPEGELEARAREYASRIAANAPLTLRSVKIAVAEGVKDPAQRDMATVEAAEKLCFASEDYQEGRRAFMEKRVPRFTGK